MYILVHKVVVSPSRFTYPHKSTKGARFDKIVCSRLIMTSMMDPSINIWIWQGSTSYSPLHLFLTSTPQNSHITPFRLNPCALAGSPFIKLLIRQHCEFFSLSPLWEGSLPCRRDQARRYFWFNYLTMNWASLVITSKAWNIPRQLAGSKELFHEKPALTWIPWKL